MEDTSDAAPRTETATLAGGCFWCTEALFRQLRGVLRVTSGYAGGDMPSPRYEQVSTGKTGHAETVRIVFDPAHISYEKLLEVFFATHDPTTLNRQGADVGPQYRSAIFYHSAQQKQTALAVKERLAASGTSGQPIVTEIVPVSTFTSAEDAHQDFYRRNPEHTYCRVVIDPKIQKLLKEFANDVNRP